MAAHRGNAAYDLSLFEERPAKVVSLHDSKKKEKEQRRHNRVQSLMNAAAVLMVSGLIVSVLGVSIIGRVRMGQLDQQITDLESQMVVMQSENVRLTDELARKTSAQSVQEYASGELGMQKAESNQIEYVPNNTGDQTVTAGDAAGGWWQTALRAVSNFFSGLAYLFQ